MTITGVITVSISDKCPLTDSSHEIFLWHLDSWILSFPRSAFFWTKTSDVVLGIYWSHSPSLWVTTPNALTTTLAPLVPLLHTSCLVSLSALGIFCELDVAFSQDLYVYNHCLLLLLVHQHDVRLVCYQQFVSLDLEVQQDLSSVILNHFKRCLPFWPNPNPKPSSPYSAQMFRYTMPTTWLYRSMCAVPACIVHPTIMCWTVSVTSLHILESCLLCVV